MTTNFDWNNAYPTVRTPVFARNIVATSQPLAAQAGLRMLAAGGNAHLLARLTAAGANCLNQLDNVHAFGDLSKHAVLPIEEGRV
jgi:gamma-glutamyltranspeptidase/glutathione hydrolase